MPRSDGGRAATAVAQRQRSRSGSGRAAAAVAQRHGGGLRMHRELSFKRFVSSKSLCGTKRSIGGFRKGRSHHPGAGSGTAVPVPAPAPPQPRRGIKMSNLQMTRRSESCSIHLIFGLDRVGRPSFDNAARPDARRKRWLENFRHVGKVLAG